MKKPLIRRPPHRAQQAGLLALALLAGCASPPTPPRGNDAHVQQFVGKGYLSEEQFSLHTAPVAWLENGRSFDFMLSVPVRPGRYPLVIYLPGLGESRTAGDGWRNTWAQAGYAVLSIQLLGEDTQAWQSPAARHGDFTHLARERYAEGLMADRQAALRGLLAALHHHSGDALLQNVDLSRVVMAGYDLGAYTAMVAAGEKYGTAEAAPLPLAGVIALSPHADFSGPAFTTRYGAVNVPVLSVTGQGDVDGYGLVTSAALRSAPFQHMPPGNKYLLMLDDASHEMFGGNPLGTADGNRDDQRPSGGEEKAGRGEGHKGRRGSMEGGQGMPRRGRDEAGGGSASGGRDWAFSLSAIRAVTTAFLDAQIKNDEFAQEWLRRDARRWLRDTAQLTVK
ncbi:MAG: hypothetical protein EKK46_13755 [Rhodocyclaceae bacterium]|nr:MAG: hypothetical protein EKK46_13755 [Rhodocyclaceae bacterium]